MATNYIAMRVRCPFYKDDEGVKLKCEGAALGSLSTHLIFADSKRRREYMDSRCCGDFKSCPVAKEIYQKYGEKQI